MANIRTPHNAEVQPNQDAQSRRSFIKKSALSAVATAGAVSLLSTDASAQSTSDFVGAFQSIREHENAHVDFLVEALGEAARPKPTFQNLEQPTFEDFANVARALENTGVGAYHSAVPLVSNSDNLVAAAQIATVEGRHAGFLNVTEGETIGPGFDQAMTQEQVVEAAGPFIADLNGGADPLGNLKNDADILNYALLLEYLEAEFYNVNVPKFIGS